MPLPDRIAGVAWAASRPFNAASICARSCLSASRVFLISRTTAGAVMASCPVALAKSRACRGLTRAIHRSARPQALSTAASKPPVASTTIRTSLRFPNERVVVKANAELSRWQAALYKRTPEAATRITESWVRGGDDLFHAEMVTGSGSATTLRDVTIYDRSGNRLLRVVRAAAARPVAGGWRLTGARVFDVARGTETAAEALDFPSPVIPAQFTVTTVNPKFVPFWDLLQMIGEQRDAGKPVGTLVAAANHKISAPLSAILMPLLGSVAAFGLARSGRLFVRAVIGMLLGFAFFVADNFMVAMGDFGTVPPILSAWAAFGLFFLIGEAVLFRTEE